MKLRFILALLLAFQLTARGEPKTFRNEGLKNETIVLLDIRDKAVTGTFVSSEYGDDSAGKHAFSGEIVSTPKGKRGVYMHIRFDGPVPYPAPPRTVILQWYLKIVDHRAHLFIPMEERSYESKTSKWVVSDVELLPDD